MGVHVLADVNVTLHDHLAGETRLEQHVRELVGLGLEQQFREFPSAWSHTKD